MIPLLVRIALALWAALGVPLAASAGPLVFVDGHYASLPAVTARGRTYVPAREIFARFHATVLTPSPRELTVVRGGRTIVVARLGTRSAIVNGRAMLLDGAPFRRGSSSFVPVALVHDAFGARITHTVHPAAVRFDNPAAAVVAPLAARESPPARPSPAAVPGDGGRAAAHLRTLGIGLLLISSLLILLAFTLQRVSSSTAERVKSRLRTPFAGFAGLFGKQRGAHKVQLRAEELQIEKTMFFRGEARVHIDVIMEEHKVKVPIRREELVIEYSGKNGGVTIDGRPLQTGEIIRIPLREERVEVTKHMVLKEDVIIGKYSIEEQQQFNETLRREELRAQKPPQERAPAAESEPVAPNV
ncbi:MAG: hypothetical protein NVSMB5_07230 [Candidatus Velthaea sp.]